MTAHIKHRDSFTLRGKHRRYYYIHIKGAPRPYILRHGEDGMGFDYWYFHQNGFTKVIRFDQEEYDRTLATSFCYSESDGEWVPA